MRVSFFHRRPYAGLVSVERVFRDVRAAMPEGIECREAIARFQSRGIFPRLYNMVEAMFRQGDVNHITGDVNYLALFLCKRRTLLTVLDCVSLRRLRGVRFWVVWFFWYWLPIKRSRLVTTISAASRDEVLDFVSVAGDKVRVVHCPVSSEFVPVAKESCSGKPVLLQVGTSQNKNLERTAEALKGIDCHLRIVGELTEAQKSKLAACKIDFSVAGRVSDDQLVEEYRRCDMVLFASTYEGFGLPIVEGNATGRPVVTGNVTSMPEVAGDAACLVDPFDVESIAKGVRRVIQDAAYRNQLIENGYRNVERFRPAAIAAQYVKLYEEIGGGLRKESNGKRL